jgi:hypothetical protein
MNRIIFSLLALIAFASNAQSQNERIRLIARQYADSVVLRWAPLNAVEWAQMNRYGYKLERFEINDNSTKNIKPKQLGPDSIRPYSLDKWKAYFPANHPWAPVAVQALYGKQFNTSMEGASSIKAQSQEAMLRYSFALLMADLDAPTAQGLALRWSDTKLPAAGSLQYRLISLHPTLKDTVEVGIRLGDPIEEVPSSPLLEAESGDKSITLRWDVMPDNPVFTAFWLERSGDYGKNWARISERPIMKTDQPGAADQERFVYFTDTLITENYKPYWYRLQGITPFAELSAYSPIQISMGKDLNAPPAPVMKEPKDVKGKIQVMWEYPDTPADFKEFRIGKSNLINGPFQPVEKAVLPARARTWIDDGTDALGENYYVVYAIDTSGNVSTSLPAYGFLLDSIAPGKPFKPMGSIDTTGVVRLHWKLGSEPDIMGYRVYFANSPDHEFSNKTPLPVRDTAFVDTITLNTLTKKIYYKIVAVDRNYNHSVYSDILVLTRPDTIRPVEPIFADFRVKEQEVQLQFVPSSSADVKEHRLMRRETGSTQWNVISKWQKPEVKREFSDKSVKGAQYYEYTLVAIDSAGNVSDYAPTVDVRVIPKQTREQIEQPVATYLKDRRVIELKWGKPKGEVDYYTVFRGKDGKRPVSLTTTDGTAVRFEDNSYTGKGKYVYMIQAVYKDKGQSPFTVFNEVVVE